MDFCYIDVLVIYIDFFSRYIWQRENDKPTAKKDEDKDAFTKLYHSGPAFTKLPHPPTHTNQFLSYMQILVRQTNGKATKIMLYAPRVLMCAGNQ